MSDEPQKTCLNSIFDAFPAFGAHFCALEFYCPDLILKEFWFSKMYFLCQMNRKVKNIIYLWPDIVKIRPTDLEQVTIPEGVEELRNGLLEKCPLKEVTLPSTDASSMRYQNFPMEVSSWL